MTGEKSKNLPTLPTGKYTPGCCDLVVGKGTDGLLVRLYYPTDQPNILSLKCKWTKMGLSTRYYPAMMRYRFNNISDTTAKITGWVMTNNQFIPSVWEAPIADGTFPLIVFSHGLTATRTTSSYMLNDIASHGFVIAAIEHKDYSAGATFVVEENGRRKWLPHKYITEKECGSVYRFNQLKYKAMECTKALDVLMKLDEGEIFKSDIKSSVNFKIFKGKINTKDPILCGHSFGGDAVLYTLTKDKRYTAGICLDPWMYPISAYEMKGHKLSKQEVAEMKSIPSRITQPVLFILVDGFQNATSIKRLHPFENSNNSFWTILGLKHFSLSDVGILMKNYPKFLKRLFNVDTDTDAEKALYLNSALIFDFIGKHLGSKFVTDGDFIEKNRKYIYNGAFGYGVHVNEPSGIPSAWPKVF